jgi:hypothetical protein
MLPVVELLLGADGDRVAAAAAAMADTRGHMSLAATITIATADASVAAVADPALYCISGGDVRRAPALDWSCAACMACSAGCPVGRCGWRSCY